MEVKQRTGEVLAAYATYKQLYDSGKYRSSYQILAEFVIYIIQTENLYEFSDSDIKSKLKQTFGFNVPRAVLISSLSKIDCISKISNSKYTFNKQNMTMSNEFSRIKECAENENQKLEDDLIQFAEKRLAQALPTNEKNLLVKDFIAYLLDESNGNKYSDTISAFIFSCENNPTTLKQISTIRSGSILYIGISCDIRETGSLTDELTIFFDMEILFDLMGYNGVLYKELSLDMIEIIRDANKETKHIKMKYFKDTKKEIDRFFDTAEEIVSTNKKLKPKEAMASIINGCKAASDVLDKRTDFYNGLQYEFSILEDDEKEYYKKSDYKSNLENEDGYDGINDREMQKNLKYLSHINKLREGNISYDCTKSKFLFITETGIVLELSKKLTAEKKDKLNEEKKIVGFAVSMCYFTNCLWFRLNKGLGSKEFPKNMDVLIKCKTVLSHLINQNVEKTYEESIAEFRDGKLSENQLASRIIAIRNKAKKPEELNGENFEDELDFSASNLERYERELDHQKVLLMEKNELLLQREDEIQKESEKLEELAEINEAKEKEKNCLQQAMDESSVTMERQNKKIKEMDRKIKELEEREQFRKNIKIKRNKIAKFILKIVARILLLILWGILSFIFVGFFTKDNSTLVGSGFTVFGIVIAAWDFYKREWEKSLESFHR